jgi:hypothetical protein
MAAKYDESKMVNFVKFALRDENSSEQASRKTIDAVDTGYDLDPARRQTVVEYLPGPRFADVELTRLAESARAGHARSVNAEP